MSSSDELSSPAGGVMEVVSHYQTYHPKSRPGVKERRLIRARLNDGYSVDDLKQAIDGNHADPFCSGDNDRGRKYHHLDLIVRDASHVDRYLSMVEKTQRRQRARDPTLDRSMAIAGFVEAARRLGKSNEWIEKHIHQPEREGVSIDDIRDQCREAVQQEKLASAG